MNKFELFNEKLEKFKGMLAENGLVGEFRAEQYPIEIEVKRDASAAQIGMFSDKSKDAMYRDTKIVLTFPVGAVGVHFFGKLVIADKTLNKIKTQGKKLHELYLQGFFAEMKESEDNDAAGRPECITGKSPSGLCSCCRADGRVCCIGCKEDCNIRCGWIDEEK